MWTILKQFLAVINTIVLIAIRNSFRELLTRMQKQKKKFETYESLCTEGCGVCTTPSRKNKLQQQTPALSGSAASRQLSLGKTVEEAFLPKVSLSSFGHLISNK